jgi:hypothetical protein
MTREFRVGRSFLPCVGALFFAASLAFSACYTGDQSCSEAYNPNDKNDHCPYGPPGGPGPAADCPIIKTIPASDPSCKINFEDDVYEIANGPNGGNCSDPNNLGCHGKAELKKIAVWNTPQEMLDSLSRYKGEVGKGDPERTYFASTAPEKSWWVCNLRGDNGSLMPRGTTPIMKPMDIAVIEHWLACGAPRKKAANVITGAGGAGGEGGSGDEGGSGQAGGP